ncbi:MAG TPA: aldehyde dehydrogenase family protein, partial [Candidatus Poseidoniales archaeon]
MEPLLNFIDGTFVPAEGGETLNTVNPATGEVITTLPRSKASDVNAATRAALNAAPA